MKNIEMINDKRKQLEQLYLDAVYYHLASKGYSEGKARSYAVRISKIFTKDLNC